jgi:hypothetical protein
MLFQHDITFVGCILLRLFTFIALLVKESIVFKWILEDYHSNTKIVSYTTTYQTI